MPLSASSKSPFVSFKAPVKEPALWPNISLSSRSRLKEEQLIATKAFPLRELCWWMDWAKTSFPVPVSPVSSTGTSVCATLRARAIASCMAGDLPTMVSNEYCRPTGEAVAFS